MKKWMLPSTAKKKKMVSNNFKKLLELKEIAIRKKEQICKEWKTVKG